jgi:hypothetical protein
MLANVESMTPPVQLDNARGTGGGKQAVLSQRGERGEQHVDTRTAGAHCLPAVQD